MYVKLLELKSSVEDKVNKVIYKVIYSSTVSTPGGHPTKFFYGEALPRAPNP